MSDTEKFKLQIIFIDAIIKALYEKNPIHTHFNKTTALKYHITNAIKNGYINENCELTDLGKNRYISLHLDKLKEEKAIDWASYYTYVSKHNSPIKNSKNTKIPPMSNVGLIEDDMEYDVDELEYN